MSPRDTLLPPEAEPATSTHPTEPDAGPWLCLAGEATTRADVAPRCLLEPVASAVAGEP